MLNSEYSAPNRARPAKFATGRHARRLHTAGFSLVEITLCIGIIAFCFAAVFGLIPTGLTVFRQAMNLTLGAQIAQREIATQVEKDFGYVISSPDQKTPYTGTQSPAPFRMGPIYYNENGGTVPSAADANYWVNIRVLPSTPMPGGGGSPVANPNLATVTVQVAFNPSAQALAMGADNLWTGAFTSAPDKTRVVPIVTFLTRVARNK